MLPINLTVISCWESQWAHTKLITHGHTPATALNGGLGIAVRGCNAIIAHHEIREQSWKEYKRL